MTVDVMTLEVADLSVRALCERRMKGEISIEDFNRDREVLTQQLNVLRQLQWTKLNDLRTRIDEIQVQVAIEELSNSKINGLNDTLNLQTELNSLETVNSQLIS